MSPRHADPVETPFPRPASSPSLAAVPDHECLYPELIDDVRQARKRKDRTAQIAIAAATIVAGALITLASCLYAQGQAVGETRTRIEQAESRAREDRGAVDALRERQRLDATEAAQRHEELLQELHRLDSRLGRIEERLTPRR